VTAVELRRAFDAAFAEPPPAVGAMTEDLLGLGFGLAGDSYAVRLSDIAGLLKDRHVTSLPSPRPDFLGVAGVQGSMVSVYDLGSVLGHPPTTNPRWLLLILTPEPVGLAFEVFEGQFRVPRELIALTSAGNVRHVSEAVRTADLLRHVIDIASVVEAVKSQARPAGPAKER
jgi:chemotaxis signal transduction protein